jgi:nucleoside-diphosphate-sugar epimerase
MEDTLYYTLSSLLYTALHCFTLQTIILGPQLPGQSHLNTSSASLLGLIDGSWSEVPNACKGIVDVRDCAAAHVNALEKWDTAAGRRYVLLESAPHYSEMANIIRDFVPEELKAKVPTAVSSEIGPTALGNPPPFPVLFDNTPSKEILGIEYHSAQEMITLAVESLLANGFNSSSQYSKDKL